MLTLAENRHVEEFRTCEYCLRLLQHRDAVIELQTVKPIITQFYERLREYTDEGAELRQIVYKSIIRINCNFHYHKSLL